jgi:3-deoxy-manno-octulosonate cytidylyltransferase (CMP-KDO synthetase)
MKAVGLIPSRYGSTRLPAKALALIAGEPMIWHVYQRACEATLLDQVIVATDSELILEAVRDRGGLAVLTDARHPSGTDRIAEVASNLDCDVVVNIQGDEPLMRPEIIDTLVAPFASPDLRMATVATPIRDAEELHDPAVVKVVLDQRGFAMYFSRSPMPYFRLDTPGAASDNVFADERLGLTALKHLGIYAYRRDTLVWLSRLAPTPLERAEKLEQLRALGHSCPIRVIIVDYSPPGVDTPEDLERARRMMEEGIS